jgi:hypothetical protein
MDAETIVSRAPRFRRTVAMLACAASLAAGAAALGPAGAAARAPSSCGSKDVAVKEAGKTLTVPVSRITVSGGATCKQAYAVIRGVLLKEVPKGWKVSRGGFKVPHGLVAQQAVDGHKVVRFATIGPSSSA